MNLYKKHVEIGEPAGLLSEEEVYQICSQALQVAKIDDRRILAVIPDLSRSAPMDIMFRTVYTLLVDRARRLDFIIASGTHPPLSEQAINRRVGITREERKSRYARARFFNHHWQQAEQLKYVGTISADEVAQISGGLIRQKVDISVNKMVFDYDLLMIIGPTFPHEVVGFSGGNKYLFPGIAGQDIIDMFHWLGALITNPRIIGYVDTPVRKIVDKAASLLPVEKICLSLVVKEKGLAGLFIGTPEEAWRAAADLSRQIHIIYKEHPFKKVLSCAPAMYEDMWTGGKCMYKLEPVVADGGELIIYAPHIKEISVTHGAVLETIGYHVRDYFAKQMDKFRQVPGGVMAHSTHVKGIGTFEKGAERPRIKVTLATGIPEKICKKINLGYLDPALVNPDDWKNREEEGILYVPRAGEILYRLKEDPFTG
jgi:nickel-dependent lactate racemase